MIEASFDTQLLKDSTVVMSSLSFVPNDFAAIETLIERLSMKKVGSMFCSNLQPVVFANSSDSACDVYQNPEAFPGITVLCLRTRVLGMTDFMTQLRQFFAAAGASLFMLSSIASLFCSLHDGCPADRLKTRGVEIALNGNTIPALKDEEDLTGCGLLKYVVDCDADRSIKCIAVTSLGQDIQGVNLLVDATLSALSVGSESRNA